MPEARELIAGASYDPQTLNMIGKAFDEAWAIIARNYHTELAAEAGRLKLANIVLSLAADGERDFDKLKDRSVRVMAVDDP
jgi:hypothetical protein